MLEYKKLVKKFKIFLISLLSLTFITGFSVSANAKALVVGQIAEPKSLDPSTVTAVNDFRIVMNIYDGLVRYTDGKLEVARNKRDQFLNEQRHRELFLERLNDQQKTFAEEEIKLQEAVKSLSDAHGLWRQQNQTNTLW